MIIVMLLVYVPIGVGLLVYGLVVLWRSFKKKRALQVAPVAIESSLYAEIKPPKDNSCAICLTMFRDQDSVTVLKCPHLFHIKCLQPWLVIQSQCPLCRINIESIYDPPIENI